MQSLTSGVCFSAIENWEVHQLDSAILIQETKRSCYMWDKTYRKVYICE